MPLANYAIPTFRLVASWTKLCLSQREEGLTNADTSRKLVNNDRVLVNS